MTPLDDLIAAAREAPRRIVLSEGEDVRIAEGAVRAHKDGTAHPILIGRASEVADRLSSAGAGPAAFETVDPVSASKRQDYAEAFYDLRKHKGVDEEAAFAAMNDPLQFAAMMVRQGDGDGTIGGAVATTGDTVRAALQLIGRAPGVATVSSFFLMMLYEHHHPKNEVVVFADCGLIVEPTVEELAQIAMSSADSFTALVGETPRIAMLSFSTMGSARHDRVTRVVDATGIVKSARPDLLIDGEIQFDAAFVPHIGVSKAPASPLGGEANVFVFPGLESANIGYKIAQRIGGATAIGPILQGLNRPANDLSRGCSVDDVYHLIAVTSVQAAANS